jgi:hypothetical protein
VRKPEDAADQTARDHRILSRMLADADELCRSDDALLVGQYRHLRGRISALIEVTMPLREEQAA